MKEYKDTLIKIVIGFAIGLAVTLSFSSYEKKELIKIQKEETQKIEKSYKEKEESYLKKQTESQSKISSLQQKLKKEQYKKQVDKDKYVKIVRNADGSSTTEIIDKSKSLTEKQLEEQKTQVKNNEESSKSQSEASIKKDIDNQEKSEYTKNEKTEIERSEKRGANWLLFGLGLLLGAFGVPLL